MKKRRRIKVHHLLVDTKQKNDDHQQVIQLLQEF